MVEPADQPAWCRSLPLSIQPDAQLALHLEQIRRKYDLPHDFFAAVIGEVPATTERMTRVDLWCYLRENPHVSERDALSAAARRRLEISPPGDPLFEHREAFLAQVPELKTLDDLVMLILQCEYDAKVWANCSPYEREVNLLLSASSAYTSPPEFAVADKEADVLPRLTRSARNKSVSMLWWEAMLLEHLNDGQ